MTGKITIIAVLALIATVSALLGQPSAESRLPHLGKVNLVVSRDRRSDQGQAR